MSLEAEETPLSSPDPLANSPDITAFSSPSKPARVSLPANYTPKGTISTPKNETVQLQNFVISTPSNKLNTLDLSPTRSKAKTENALSPWRIRVTVEAERDESGNSTGKGVRKLLDFESQAKKPKARTTVTTVPVKGLESSPPAPKRRGRPRKSGTTPVKRNGTPRPTRRSKRLSMDGVLEGIVQNTDSVLIADNLSTLITTTGRSGTQETSMTAPPAPEEVSPAKGKGGRRGRGRRNIGSPVKIAIDPQLDSHKQTPSEETGVSGESGQVLRDIDVNSATSSSAASTQHAPESHDATFEFRKETSKSRPEKTTYGVTALMHTRSRGTGAEVQTRPTDDEDLWRDLTRNDGLDPDSVSNQRAQELGYEQNIEHFSGGSDGEQGEDGNIHPGELDSVLESEGFSMVSIASIPSAREHLSSPPYSRPAVRGEPSMVEVGEPNLHQILTSVDGSGGSRSATNLNHHARSKPDRQSSVAFEEAISDYPKSSMLMALTKSPQPPIKYRSQVQIGPTINHSASPYRGNRASLAGADIRSSPPILTVGGRTRPTQQTPSIVYSSPSLPPPLHPPSTKKSQTPKLARVIRTGIVLQGILSNEARLRSPFSSPSKGYVNQKSPRERLDDLFSGFGDGTRRELRAGLRLGEELAKRQAENNQDTAQKAPIERGEADDVFTEERTEYPRLPTPDDSKEYSLPLPDKQPQEVKYPALLSPGQSSSPAKPLGQKDYDAMSWRVDTPVKGLHADATSQTRAEQEVGNETNWSTMEGREAKWQRERQAVSRQIENANTSQVIVIDDTAVLAHDDAFFESSSQDELAEPDHEPRKDIWQEEAYSTSLASLPGLPVAQDPYPTVDMLKPPRGKIPSPWRRDGEMVYSDEAVEDEAALFWQPDTCSKQASRAREERRRRKDEAKLEVPRFPTLKTASPTKESIDSETLEASNDEQGPTLEESEDDDASVDENLTGAQDEENEALTERSDDEASSVGATDEINSETYSDGEPEEDYTDEPSSLRPDDVDDGDSRIEQAEATSGFIDTSSRQVVRQLNHELDAAAVKDDSRLITQTNDAVPQAPAPGFRSRFLSGLSAFTPSFLQSQSKTTVFTVSQKTSTNVASQTTMRMLNSERLAKLISDHSAELSICEPWSITNYKVIQELYKLARAAPSVSSKYTTHRYYGKTVAGNGHSIVLECKELWVVEAFTHVLRQESPAGRAGGKIEFDEWYLARRIFSLVYGEECRREEAEAERQKELKGRSLGVQQAHP